MTPTPEGILSTSEIWVAKPEEEVVIPVIEEQEDDLPKL
jgi:hypothetical protein